MANLMVIFALLVSCTLVVCEMTYRFSERRLKLRYLLNAFSQWLVFLCLTVMLGFARKNDAAVFRFPLRRLIFIPIHILYLTMIVVGMAREEYHTCYDNGYPKIFQFQYGLFYMTYFLFLILHHKDYCLKWHDDIAQLNKMHP